MEVMHCVVLEPSECDINFNALSREIIFQAAHDWLMSDRRIEGGTVVESYIAPHDFMFENGVHIKKGSWVIGVVPDEWKKKNE